MPPQSPAPPQPPANLPTPQFGPPVQPSSQPPVPAQAAPNPGPPVTNYAPPQVIQPSPQFQPPANGYAPPMPAQPTASPEPSYGAAPQHDYGFIMNPAPPPKKPLLPPLSASGSGPKALIIRVSVVAGGLIVLLIMFSFVKGLLAGDSNRPQLVAVLQNQQKIIHVAQSTAQQTTATANLSTNNKNLAATAQLSLTSSQTDMQTYLGTIGMKTVGDKQLNQQVSLKTDEQLTASVAADTYNPTFQAIMKDDLAAYQRALSQAYDKTPGPNGRKLLNDQFNQSKLLVQLLDAPTADATAD